MNDILYMAKKNIPDKHGFVYSTDPGFSFERSSSGERETLPPARQRLSLWLDKRNRAGKTVTAISGFIGSSGDLEALGKKIRAHCGSGGSVKNGEILIQGDQLEKVRKWLRGEGYGIG
jgi:translation initiation factor 1